MKKEVIKKAYALLLRDVLAGDKTHLPRVYVCGDNVFVYKAAALRHMFCENANRGISEQLHIEVITIHEAYEMENGELMPKEFKKKVDWNFQSNGTVFTQGMLFNPLLCESYHRDLRFDSVNERIKTTQKD